jgi:hypothetical protein
LKPAGALRNRLLDLVVARIDPSRDAALRHLVEARPVRSIWSAISPIGRWPRPVRASANGGAQRTNCRASLDRLQPILLNHAVGGGTWADYDVDETRERTLACRIAEGSPALWRAAESVIEDAVRRGWLRPAPGA